MASRCPRRWLRIPESPVRSRRVSGRGMCSDVRGRTRRTASEGILHRRFISAPGFPSPWRVRESGGWTVGLAALHRGIASAPGFGGVSPAAARWCRHSARIPESRVRSRRAVGRRFGSDARELTRRTVSGGILHRRFAPAPGSGVSTRRWRWERNFSGSAASSRRIRSEMLGLERKATTFLP